MWKLIWREMTRRGSRFFPTVFAVVLGVTFLTATLGITDLMTDAAKSSVTATLSGDLYAVTPPTKDAVTPDLAARGSVSDELVPIIEAADGVAHAVPQYEGQAVLLDQAKHPVSIGLTPTLVHGAFPYPPGPEVAAGRLPQGPKEVMLELSTARRAGLKTGQTATLIWGGATHRLKVVGLAQFKDPLGTATLAFVDGKDAKTWFSPTGKIKLIGIHVAPAADPDNVKERVQDAVGPDAVILTGAALRAQQSAAVARTVSLVNLLALAFVALALLAGAFLIANTFGILVASRYRMLGMLRTAGYTPHALRMLVVGEALLIGLIGSVLGEGVGLALVVGIRQVLTAQGWVFTSGVPLGLWRALAIVALGVFITVVACFIPAWRAGRMTPLDALAASAPVPEGRRRGVTIFGLLVLVVAIGLGAVALLEASRSEVGMQAAVLGMAATLLGLSGVLCLTPVLLRPFLWFFSALFRRGQRLPALLALRNLRRYPRRTSLGAAALVLGIAIATTGGILADSARKSLQSGVTQEVQSDLVVASLQPSTNVEKAVSALRKVDGVRSADADIFSAPMLVRLDQDPTRSLTVAGITADQADNLVSLQVKTGDVKGLANGRALVNARDAAREGWKVGDAITVTGPRGIYSTKVAGIVHSTLLDAAIFLDPQYLRQAAAPESLAFQYIFVNLKSENAAAAPSEIREIQNQIQHSLNQFYVYRVYTPVELSHALSQTTTQVLWLMYALLGLSIVIAILGIVNTLALAMIERRQIFALLRVLGLTPREVRASLRWEAFFLALLGAGLGWISGLVIGMLWRWMLRDFGLSAWGIPVLGQLGFVAAAVILAVLAASWPVRKTVRTPALMATLAS